MLDAAVGADCPGTFHAAHLSAATSTPSAKSDVKSRCFCIQVSVRLVWLSQRSARARRTGTQRPEWRR